ncbi:MAG: SprB repeat-containing protein, partial [Bacteroidia bacterium]|nr:SprB repeat-containing protein [Bacteroidia bacterium]
VNISIQSANVGCLGYNDGYILASVSGGTPPYSYSWSTGQTTQNIFGLGAGVYILTVTDAGGCITQSIPVLIRNSRCVILVDISLFIDGFYMNFGSSTPMDNFGSGGCLSLALALPDPEYADSVTVSLVDTGTYAIRATSTGILHTDGSLETVFNDTTLASNEYWIKINHRNTLETWSSQPVLIEDTTHYDFTMSVSSAYGNNLRDLGNGRYAIWSGDVNQDGFVESSDFSQVENDSQQFLFGYVVSDLTGDNLVESSDYGLIQNNSQLFLILARP